MDYTGIYKCDLGIKDGKIFGMGKAGNPDVMADVTPGMVRGCPHACTHIHVHTDVMADVNPGIVRGYPCVLCVCVYV